MAADLVTAATSETLTDLDLSKSIQICELVASDHRQSKDVVKAIKKLLVSKNSNTQLFTVMLLEMLMNNIGEPIHKQVIDMGLLPILVKIVKKKSDLPAREKIFLLLDATQTSVGGASGRFPQYYTAYYDLVSAGVEFPRRPRPVSNSNNETLVEHKRNNHVASNAREIVASPGNQRNPPKAKTEQKTISNSSTIIQKASAALEVLREVVNAVDTKNPVAAKDEFTLDLVEQCSFQKQRVMHLAMTSRDDKAVSQAIELNEQLDKVLKRHDLLVSGNSASFIPNQSNQEDDEEEEEEEAEQLFRRMRKGKGCAKEEKEDVALRPSGLQLEERLHRPLIIRTQNEDTNNNNGNSGESGMTSSLLSTNGRVIPPPPAKHVERERFFHEANNHKGSDGDSLSGHVRGLSLHTRTPSAASRVSLDSNDSY